MPSSEKWDTSSGVDNEDEEYVSCRIADLAAIRATGIRMRDKLQEGAHVVKTRASVQCLVLAYHN